MIGYYVSEPFRSTVKIAKVSYEKRSKVMATGVKKIKDIVGPGYYVPSKVENALLYDSLVDAILAVMPYAIGRRDQEQDLIDNLERILREDSSGEMECE
jgi:hypothetical protein